MKTVAKDETLELPIYGLSEAALYLRLPIKTLEYWVFGKGAIRPIIKPAGNHPRSLSFMNLLECHMLAAMRSVYDLKLPKIRRALTHLSTTNGYSHPLIEKPLFTNRVDVLIKEIDGILNIPGRTSLASMKYRNSSKRIWSGLSMKKRRLSFTPSSDKGQQMNTR